MVDAYSLPVGIVSVCPNSGIERHVVADGADLLHGLFFFKQKTAYEIGTGDWSSDVCSSDLQHISK